MANAPALLHNSQTAVPTAPQDVNTGTRLLQDVMQEAHHYDPGTLIVLAPTEKDNEEVQRWSEGKANDWYRKQPWLVGANYIPAAAINQLEMWQAETFDPARIDQELSWAQDLGMNTMRVFLHDLLWQQDKVGFRRRLDTFLTIARKHKIRPLLVLFDSVWDPNPQLGPQRAPQPGLHNSGWMQSPGAKALQDAKQHPRLEAYVKGVMGAFANDDRILAWDVWNEPDNLNIPAYANQEPENKGDLVLALLPRVFTWARSAHPCQPLTSGVWKGNWSASERLSAIQCVQLEQSDIISFHSYDHPEEFERRIQWLQRYKRPLFCTEYLARADQSTFQGTMPLARKYNVALYNWGLVVGKTQTHLPWDSWQKPYADEPDLWFHEIFGIDGTPYRQDEVDFIREITGKHHPVRQAA